MRRRDFFEMGAALAIAQATPAPRQQTRPAAPRRALMKLGTQHGDSDDILRVMAAFGVTHICSSTPSNRLDEKWSVEGLMRLRERVEQYGIKLEMVPFPTSAYITQSGFPNVMLGQSPERDREIEQACQMIRNVARAGIPAIKYNLTILGVVRTESDPGPGRCPLQLLRLLQGSPAATADRGRRRQRGRALGAHQLLPPARRAGGRGVQSQDGLPSA